MKKRKIGYARSATGDFDAQVTALEAAGCDLIYREHVSGRTGLPPVMQEAIAALRAGDAFVIADSSRLGRSIEADRMARAAIGSKDVSLVILDAGLPGSNAEMFDSLVEAATAAKPPQPR